MHSPALPSRYEQPRLLGAGGMGTVFAAFDREREATVAIKVFNPAPGADEAAARFLFQQEFWALASLSHPNLVAAYDYGEAEGTPYFTMELVDGTDWGAAFPLDEAAVRQALPGILAALGHLHGQGWVHADLKPENVRITSAGHVKVMDLGLLTRVGTSAGVIRGSLSYMAPEQIRQVPVDGRTDLYALGCMLYHALAGRPPFVNDSAPSLLRDHLDTTAVPPGVLGVTLSAGFEAALMALLAKRPQDRPAHVWELAERLGIQMATAASVGLLGSPLVGAASVTTALERRALALREAWFGCVVGPAGAGKSRLLAETRAKSQLRGDAVLTARGDGDQAPPYAAVRPWLRAIVAERPRSLERLGPAIARLVPEVRVAPAPALEGMQERVRLHGALAELAKEAWPGFRVFLVDDWHRLDAASAELILALARVGGTAWCFVATSSNEAPAGAEGLELPALDEAAMRELAGNLLGQPAPEHVAERLVAASVGRPGQAEAVLQHWIATGALVHVQGRWEASPNADWELTGGLAQVAEAQLAALGGQTAGLLKDAALLGAEGPLPLLAAVANLPEAAFFAALAEAERAGVLERERERYRFTRPAQAEILASARDAAEARAAHTRAAAYWQWECGIASPLEAPLDLVLALARHLLAGEAPLTGVPWALAGARRALAIYALAPAERLLAPLLALDGLEGEARTEALALMAYTHRFAARIDDGLAVYEQELLARLVPQSGHGIDHRVSYGILLMQKGRYDDASRTFAEAIADADAQGDSVQAIRGRLFAGRMAVFTGKPEVARGYLGEAIARARAAHEASPERALLAGALGLYGYLTASAGPGHEAEALGHLDEAVALCEAQGDLARLYEALNTKGNVLAGAGRYREGRDVYARALALCERMGTANEALVAHLNVGGGALELGDLRDALHHAELVALLAGAQGRKFPQAYAEALAGLSMVWLGRVPEGIGHAERGVVLARELGNKYLELNVRAYQARALAFAGRLDEATAAIASARELATATQNKELNPKLDRLDATLALDAGAADGFDRMITAIAAARR
ncbi:MAG: putative serine/threonine protein kinase, partial [Cyanobacteria bacterium RYN_339]|nr:putative serine/threonine protein kinase [Cyanobacteria bacterium RYN_339]